MFQKKMKKFILKRTERDTGRTTGGWKVTKRKEKLAGGIKTVDGSAKANEAICNGHELRRDDDSVLKITFHFELNGRRKRG